MVGLASPANSRQWGRRVSLRVTSPEGLTEINGPTTERDKQLRVTFSVEKSISESPNKARITVSNLAPRTRDRLSGITRRVIDFDLNAVKLAGLGTIAVPTAIGQPIELVHQIANSVYVSLLAGYGIGGAQIFEGTLARADTQRGGADQILTLEPVDGQLGYTQAVFDKPFAKGATILSILKEAVRVCGWSEGTPLTPATVPVALTKPLTGPFYEPGLAIDTIKTLMVGLGFISGGIEWWVDDGAFWITAKGRPLPGVPIVLTDQPGPGGKRILQSKRVESDGLQVQTLLNPALTLGAPVTVLSAQYGGVWRCERVVHNGDNRGSQFSTVAILRDFL